MTKHVLLAIVLLAASAAAAYTLNMIDTIVHGTLYSYGLQFSYDWASPYWTLLRIIQVLLSIVIVTTIADILFTVRTYVTEKKPMARASPYTKVVKKAPVLTRASEGTSPIFAEPRPLTSTTTAASPVPSTQPPISRPTPAPTPLSAPVPVPSPSHADSDASGLFKCAHCGKTFTQPLRMLDFQGDRPRIVNICPFCNETLPSAARADEMEQKQDDRSLFKRDDHVPRTTAQ